MNVSKRERDQKISMQREAHVEDMDEKLKQDVQQKNWMLCIINIVIEVKL